MADEPAAAGGLGRHVVKPQRVEAKPKIDGVLNEAEWGRAARITNFGQVEPREGEKPSERTEVRLMRTEEVFYLGVTCLDGTPAGVLARDRWWQEEKLRWASATRQKSLYALEVLSELGLILVRRHCSRASCP